MAINIDQLEDKLSERELAFCLEYLKDFNGSRAVADSNYSTNKDSANKIAYQLLHKPHIADYLISMSTITNELALKQGVMTKQRFVHELVEMLEYHKRVVTDDNGSSDMRNANVALKAIELIGKHLGYFNQVIEDSKGDMRIVIQRPY